MSRRPLPPIGIVLSLAACTAGASDGSEHPSFSPEGKFDGTEASVRFVQDVGSDATVKGRFQRDLKYRGFTVALRAGEQLQLDMSAQRETNGIVTDEEIESQLMLYGPVDGAADLFEDVIADSGEGLEPSLTHDVDEEGLYLVVATRPADNDARFQLDIKCPNCQVPVDPARECVPGRMFIEGASLRSQEWRRCEVVVLEPTRLPEEETLVIGPDVEVRAHYFITDFHEEGWGEVELTIDGQLELESRPKHPVRFDSNVPDKMWQGLVINREGTRLHDFELSDAVQGVVVQASNVQLSDGEIELSRRGVTIAAQRVSGLEIERMRFHDNDVAITNRWSSEVGGTDHHLTKTDALFLLDSTFEVNGTAIDLAALEGSFLDGLTVAHNGTGLQLAGARASETDFPEDWFALTGSRVVDNEIGIVLSANGVVDGCLLTDNATSALQAMGGWHKVKNSRVEHNGRDCDLSSTSFGFQQDCGALYAGPDAHTVFRNNVVKKNKGHGIVLEGRIGNSAPRDPAVLNSEITHNAGSGVLLYNAPIASVEFNVIDGNESSQVGYQWRSCTVLSNNGMRCQLNTHRVERNNIGAENPLSFVANREFATLSFRTRTGGTTFADVSPNFWDGLTAEELQAMREGIGTTEADPLDQPEPFAGLIVPLPDFE